MTILNREYLKKDLPESLDRARNDGQMPAGSLGDRLMARREARGAQRGEGLGDRLEAWREARSSKDAPEPAPSRSGAWGWDNSRAQADDEPNRTGGRDR